MQTFRDPGSAIVNVAPPRSTDEQVPPSRSAQHGYRNALVLLVTWATLTGAWLGLLLIVPGLHASSVPYAIVFGVAHIVILSGLWAGLARTDLPSGSRLRVWLALAIPFTAWLAVICA